jgi:hypothetical protein
MAEAGASAIETSKSRLIRIFEIFFTADTSPFLILSYPITVKMSVTNL